MRAKNTILIFSISFLLISFLWKTSTAASPETRSSMFFEVGEDRLVMQVESMPLGDILYEMQGEYFQEISGIEHRRNELITFNASGKTFEDILKQLLKYLDEDNYAFEFMDEDLKRVTVLPDSKTEPASSPQQETDDDSPGGSMSAARVHSVIEGSQAEAVGLAEGDMIIEYNGVKIDSSMRLIREVRKKSGSDQVEIIVMREGTIIPFILKGGLIGVRISTAEIPQEGL